MTSCVCTAQRSCHFNTLRPAIRLPIAWQKLLKQPKHTQKKLKIEIFDVSVRFLWQQNTFFEVANWLRPNNINISFIQHTICYNLLRGCTSQFWNRSSIGFEMVAFVKLSIVNCKISILTPIKRFNFTRDASLFFKRHMCLSGYYKGTSFDLFFKMDSARQPLLLDHDFSCTLSFDSCKGSRLQAFLATSIQCYKLSILKAFHVTRPSFFKSYSLSVFTQRHFTRKILLTFWTLVSTKNDKQNTLWVPNYSKNMK